MNLEMQIHMQHGVLYYCLVVIIHPLLLVLAKVSICSPFLMGSDSHSRENSCNSIQLNFLNSFLFGYSSIKRALN